eukprot:344630-Chlamydomonas_euryale.AAC.1
MAPYLSSTHRSSYMQSSNSSHTQMWAPTLPATVPPGQRASLQPHTTLEPPQNTHTDVRSHTSGHGPPRLSGDSIGGLGLHWPGWQSVGVASHGSVGVPSSQSRGPTQPPLLALVRSPIRVCQAGSRC